MLVREARLEADIVANRQGGDEVKLLKHQSDLFAAAGGAFSVVKA
jgi:hypothetical protein